MAAAKESAAEPVRETDYTTRDGAQRLKTAIEAYWLARGHNVRVVLNDVGFDAAVRAARCDVRSDMRNGLPAQPRKAKDDDAA